MIFQLDFWHRNIIIKKHGQVSSTELKIYKANEKIFYGSFVISFHIKGCAPKNFKDMSRIKRLQIETVVKFTPDNCFNK